MEQEAQASRGRLGTLLHNTAALSVGRLGSKILVFLLVRFYTGVLTDAQYGTADLITNLANLLIPLACAGLSSGFFRFVAEARNKKERKVVLNTGLLLLLITSLIFLCLSPLLLLWHYFSTYVLLIIAYVLCANLHYFCTEYIRGLGMYHLFAWQGLLNTALNIALNLIFLLPLNLGVTGYVLSILLADLFSSVFVIVRAKLWRVIALRRADMSLLRDMLRFCLPLIPASVCWWIISVSDRYMVAYFCGDAANGLYTAAYKIPNLLTICGTVFVEAWQFSAVVENRTQDDEEDEDVLLARKKRVTRFFTQVFGGYSALLMLGGGCMIVCAQLLAHILFDQSFFAAWVYIPVLLGATVFSALSSFVSSVYLVEKKAQLSLLTTAIGALINLVFNFLLIPAMGAMGAAVATLIAYFALLLIRLLNAGHYIPFSWQPTRLGINTVLLVLLALSLSLQWSFPFLVVPFFFLLVLNNVGPLWRSVISLWKLKKGKKTQKIS